jgi:hypothetical protein
MWLFTQYGFFSVVCARDLTEHQAGIDDTMVMLRARKHKHLEAIRNRFAELQACEVRETTNTDYRYRLIIPKALWQQIAGSLAAEIDYGNFKSRAHARSGDPAYVDALHDVWAIMEKLQRRAAGSPD